MDIAHAGDELRQVLQPQVVEVIAFHQPKTEKSSAAWKIPEMDTLVLVASWSVVVAARVEDMEWF